MHITTDEMLLCHYFSWGNTKIRWHCKKIKSKQSRNAWQIKEKQAIPFFSFHWSKPSQTNPFCVAFCSMAWRLQLHLSTEGQGFRWLDLKMLIQSTQQPQDIFIMGQTGFSSQAKFPWFAESNAPEFIAH